MQNFLKKLVPLVIVLSTFMGPMPNIWRAVIFVVVTFVFLRPRKKEIFLWAFANIFFVINDIGAIQNGFFRFTEPDLLSLPYWEFVAWGFWILYLYRLLPIKFPTNVDLRTLVMAVLFSTSFAIIPEKNLVLLFTSSILVVYLLTFQVNYNLFWVVGFGTLGGLVEATGLYFNHWTYPEADLVVAILQFLVMWAGVGVLFRNLLGPFMTNLKVNRSVYRNAFSPSVPNDSQMKISGATGLRYTFQQYIEMSEIALRQSNARKSIECAREALASAQTPVERAQAHLLLSQNYRMIVQMRNARKEIEYAFIELGLEVPRNYILQTLKYLPAFIKSYVRHAPMNEPIDVIKLKVRLYEEIGLAGYYLREETLMIQSSIRAYTGISMLGPSVEMVKWLGATICILTLKSQKRLAAVLKSRALGLLATTQNPAMDLEWSKWECLFTDYEGAAPKSAELLQKLLSNHQNELATQDFRLCALTLSCNYLLRGHFADAIKSIELVFHRGEDKNGNYFSSTRPHVDWYQIGALGFLRPSEEWNQQLRSSQAIFSQTDHEKWAITQYLGQRLFVIYASGDLNAKTIDEIEERFYALNLSPQQTFLEAAFFWVALALVRVDQFSRKEIEYKKAKKVLIQLNKLYKHPVLEQYNKILNQRFEIILSENKKITPLADGFEKELLNTKNILGQQELRRNQVWQQHFTHGRLPNSTRKAYEDELASLQWSQYQQMIQIWLATLSTDPMQKELV